MRRLRLAESITMIYTDAHGEVVLILDDVVRSTLRLVRGMPPPVIKSTVGGASYHLTQLWVWDDIVEMVEYQEEAR
tara:strand:- start:119 stop:346 length:228 start_codon:yes stop_codon:yes gene_type:complete